MGTSICQICGAREQIQQTMKPAVDDQGDTIYVEDPLTHEWIPQLVPGPQRVFMVHDPVKHGIKRH